MTVRVARAPKELRLVLDGTDRMREQDHPFAVNELVKIDGTIGRLRLEVGSYASQSEAVSCQH